MRDAASPIHTIEGLHSPVLAALLAFVYEGSCEVEAGLLTEVLDAAARLVVDPLKGACACAIQAQLGPHNALDVWRLADLYTLPALEKAAVTSALGGFEELPLQSASGAQVLALVQEDGLVAKNEEAVFRWVLQWWEAAERPIAELLSAMKHVRFAAMDAGFLRTTVGAWPALRFQEGHEILFDSLLDAVQGIGRALPRSGFGPRLVYVLGGGAIHGEILSTVEAYDLLTGAWNQVSAMPTGRTLHAGAALGDKIYILGGIADGDRSLSTADVYDPQSDSWQPLAEMSIGRQLFAVVATGGKIYAVGGEMNYDSVMTTVEAFDPQLGVWAAVASMSVGRRNHAAAVVDGKIYAISGVGPGGQLLDLVEEYDPQANSWQQMASLPQARYNHAAVAMGGKIYVTGGCFDDDNVVTSTTVMVFNPQANTWTQMASMGTSRKDHASAVFGGKLYVFGGLSSANGSGRLTSVEAYDPISNTWAQVS